MDSSAFILRHKCVIFSLICNFRPWEETKRYTLLSKGSMLIERKKIVSERDSKVKQEVMTLLEDGCPPGEAQPGTERDEERGRHWERCSYRRAQKYQERDRNRGFVLKCTFLMMPCSHSCWPACYET